jgi:hypothetical protein
VQARARAGAHHACRRGPFGTRRAFECAGVCLLTHTPLARHTDSGSLSSHANCHERWGAPPPSTFVPAWRVQIAAFILVGKGEFVSRHKVSSSKCSFQLLMCLIRFRRASMSSYDCCCSHQLTFRITRGYAPAFRRAHNGRAETCARPR